MSDVTPAANTVPPAGSFRRFPFMRIVPWLMLASSLRFLGFGAGGGIALLTTVLSDIAAFFAFLLAARAMIEWTGGSARMGRGGLRAELTLAHHVLWRVLALMLIVSGVAHAAGYPFALHLLLGFDGIAFDQFTRIGMIWSSALAAIILVMLVGAQDTGRPRLFAALQEIARRWRHMVPAIAAVAVAHVILNFAQGHGRAALYALWQEPAPPVTMMNFLYFAFVFGFATLRLWATLAILTFALRESYRSNGALSASRALPPPA